MNEIWVGGLVLQAGLLVTITEDKCVESHIVLSFSVARAPPSGIRQAAARFADHPGKPHGRGGRESAETDRIDQEVRMHGVHPLGMQSAEKRRGGSSLPSDQNSRSQTGLDQILCRDGCGSAIHESASLLVLFFSNGIVVTSMDQVRNLSSRRSTLRLILPIMSSPCKRSWSKYRPGRRFGKILVKQLNKTRCAPPFG